MRTQGVGTLSGANKLLSLSGHGNSRRLVGRVSGMKSADDRLGVKVGVIGLGIMGGPMAANLVRAGYDVIGHNRSWAKTERLIATGGRGAETVAEAVSDAEFVITMLPDSPDVLGVALGEDGVFAHAKSGMIYIDTSTIAPAAAVQVAVAGRESGFRVLDAPVSGGERGAIEGTL